MLNTFHALSSYPILFLVKCLFEVFVCFLIELFVLSLSFESSLYIQGASFFVVLNNIL